MSKIIPVEVIERRILFIRESKVIIDRDLAELYGVTTKALNQAVKRNLERFPDAFLFRLTKREKYEVVTNCDHLKDLKYSYRLPYAFTEQGVAMLSSVLKSKRAIQVNILIMKTFVRLRELISSRKDILAKVAQLEKKYDVQFKIVFDALRKMFSPASKAKKIGFLSDRRG
jgi:hypothetical protein